MSLGRRHAMIDKRTIEQLESEPIEAVAERLGLQVIGHKCLCPFHDDTRPSLTFHTGRNRYRCFVCDAHGGVIDLVKGVKGVGFKEACNWLNPRISQQDYIQRGFPPLYMNGGFSAENKQKSQSPLRTTYPPDLEWLSKLIQIKVLCDPARQFLFQERHIDPRVVAWCGLTSIMQPAACWRFGKPFYDAPALLIPYYDIDGRLRSVQSRYLGANKDIPRFKFPRGANCHIYNLPILRLLQPGEELWITEGCSDCWAMLSSGRKAIAIPSATLLKEKDIEPLKRLNLHMYPDQDRPGEKLFLELRERLPQLIRHQLPTGCKDFGNYWQRLSSNNHQSVIHPDYAADSVPIQ